MAPSPPSLPACAHLLKSASSLTRSSSASLSRSTLYRGVNSEVMSRHEEAAKRGLGRKESVRHMTREGETEVWRRSSQGSNTVLDCDDYTTTEMLYANGEFVRSANYMW